MTKLPIEDVLPDLLSALRADGHAVLQAPPGAGKTTRVPLALLEAGLCKWRIVMLEPRRLAARAAAERMAQILGQPVGQTVGFRVRGEARVSSETRIEVVTEGILTRMIQSDPDLPGVSAVIFDEFHERSLNADLGLALTLEVRDALREDLIVLVMSATLDAEPVAKLMAAPVITAQGRAFPVEACWLDRPLGPGRWEPALHDLVVRAEEETRGTGGGLLVFLPGEGEIRRASAVLQRRLPAGCHVQPLFGAMDFAAQRAAFDPLPSGRKVVLATAIAETSLTIPDIRVVVDAGRARRSRFDPGSGMSRLVTERVTQAEATQRAGRAGRVAPGVCYRLWSKGEEGALAAFPPAEIEAADLAGLALELAAWGAAPGDLAFLTPPNPGPFAEAQALLHLLGALDDGNAITTHGQALSRLPLHPRLGHMLLRGGSAAADLAAVMAERDILKTTQVDLGLRIEAVRDPKRFDHARGIDVHRGALERARAEARRLRRQAGPDRDLATDALAALAYPDRIGQRRKGDAPRYVLSGGKGAILPEGDPLSGATFLVATDLDGNPREARIRMATQIDLGTIRRVFADQIEWIELCEWSRRDRRVLARRQERLGALVLEDRIWKDAPAEVVGRAMLDGVRELGLRFDGAAARLIARVELVRASGAGMPDMTEDTLLGTLEDWLLPMLGRVRTAEDWKTFDPLPALTAMLSWDQSQTLDRLAPAQYKTPLGRKVPIDYSGDIPGISVRLQEMFGVTRHPTSAGVPLVITLLSPAQRPVQVTRDLPGFWANSYADVRKDMRGRYPKHPWPDDPTQADPTLRAKPRKG